MINQMGDTNLNSNMNILQIGCCADKALKNILEKTGWYQMLGIDLSKVFMNSANKNHRKEYLPFEVADLIAKNPLQEKK